MGRLEATSRVFPPPREAALISTVTGWAFWDVLQVTPSAFPGGLTFPACAAP